MGVFQPLGILRRSRAFPARRLSDWTLLARAALLLFLLIAPATGGELAGPHCRVVFEDGDEQAAQKLLHGFQPYRAAAAVWLGLPVKGRPTIRVVTGLDGMRAAVGPGVPEWAAAVVRDDDTMAFRMDRIGRSPSNSLMLVLRHEVVHQVLNHLGGKLPRWFEEGLCVHFAGVPYLEADYSAERLAAGGGLPGLAELNEDLVGEHPEAARAYRVGGSAVSYFVRRNLDLRGLLVRVGGGQPFELAFRNAAGMTLEQFEAEWRASVTPSLPFLLFVLLENLELTLLSASALIVAIAYAIWRLRRERAMASLGE